MQRQLPVNKLFENLLTMLSEKEEYKELFDVEDKEALIKEVAKSMAEKNSDLTPSKMIDRIRENPAYLKHLLLKIVLEVVMQKHDAKTPAGQLALRAELKLVLMNSLSDIQNEKLKELVVDQMIEKLLKNDFAPRPEGPVNIEVEDKPDEKDLSNSNKNQGPQVFVMWVEDEEGNLIEAEGTTADPTAQFDKVSSINNRGSSQLLEHLFAEHIVQVAHELVSMAAYPPPTLHIP